jgi:hypothetical protein
MHFGSFSRSRAHACRLSLALFYSRASIEELLKGTYTCGPRIREYILVSGGRSGRLNFTKQTELHPLGKLHLLCYVHARTGATWIKWENKRVDDRCARARTIHIATQGDIYIYIYVYMGRQQSRDTWHCKDE